jgi:hypothetical protein
MSVLFGFLLQSRLPPGPALPWDSLQSIESEPVDPRDPRRQAGFHQRQLRRPEPITSRPDRVAMWAVVMAVVAMLAAAGSSHGSTADHSHAAKTSSALVR